MNSLSLFKIARALLAVAAAAQLTSCATIESKPKISAKDRTVQLQIFLDAHKFGPGVVDGHRGEFTTKALAPSRAPRDTAPAPSS